MASTPESLVKRKIKAILAKHGVYYAMPIGSMYGNAGVPDFLCCVPGGLFLAIEAKAGRGTTTLLQEKHLADIRTAGGVALVVSEKNLDELDQTIQTMKATKC
jgi:hypothetical protein